LRASPDKAEEERSRSSSLYDACVSAFIGTRSTPLHLLAAGILATFAAGALNWVIGVVEVVGAKPIAELSVALLLIKIYPEESSATWSFRRVAALLGLGAALALCWVVLIAWGNTRFPDVSEFGVIATSASIASSVVTAPIYEEKVVRHLLLQGLTGYAGRWPAAILISVVFALMHQSAEIWSFFASMVLCWLAIARGIGVMQRAIVHGTVNAFIMTWYFTHGFGFFV
jgi:membrane protease YdiL (CAAX protease family)